MLFQPLDRFGPMWVAMLIATVAGWIGLCVLCVGALVAQIALQFAPYFVVDRRLGGVDASRRSVSLAFANIGPVLLLWLLSLLVGVLGLVACGVGILVAMPVIWFALARAYLQLTGEDSAEVARVF